MPFIPVPNTCQCELIYNFNGAIMENTLYFEGPPTLSIAEMDILAADLVSWWTAEVAPNMVNDIALELIKVTNLTAVSSPVVEWSTALPVSGANPADPLPPQDSMVITFRTDLRGRSFRGRNYLVGFDEGLQSAGTFTPAIVGIMETAYEQLLLGAIDASFTWVVVSRYTNNAPRVTGVTTPIVGVRAQPAVRTQRRRQIGVGS